VHYVEHPLADIWTAVTVLEGELLVFVDSATQAAVGETILPYLADNELYTAGQPALVINSHCHCDHIGGNAGLKAALNATIAAHEADVAFTEDRAIQFETLFGPFSTYPELTVDEEGYHALAGADTQVDHPLTDGDRIELGRFELEVIHTPGHSPGSVALYEPSLGLLLVGDSVQGDGTTDTGVPLITDLMAYRGSMQRLAKLDVALLIADHPFKPHSSGFFRESAATQFVRESEAVANEHLGRVARLLSSQDGPVSLLDLGTQLARELGFVQPNPYVLMLASACLDEMVELGQARRLSGTGWHPASSFAVS
jgi:glyoxylase-like metal-dependent hydrolase (beta-lactamase superfamily II)